MKQNCRHICLYCVAAVVFLSGCTSFSDYVHNGFKVGPEYKGARAAVAPRGSTRPTSACGAMPPTSATGGGFSTTPCSTTWSSILSPEHQPEGVRHADPAGPGPLAIAKGEFFPQTQQATGGYSHNQSPPVATPPHSPSSTTSNLGFNLAWEMDFWGLYRRQVLVAQAQLEGSVENYDAVLVTLLADVSQSYVTMRQTQERIELARRNVKLQRDVLKIVQARFEAGALTELDVDQQQTTLSQTEATIPAVQITLRQSQDQLCTLLGIPPTDLRARLGQRPIPACPAK